MLRRLLLSLSVLGLLFPVLGLFAQDGGHTPPKLDPPVLGEFDPASVSTIDPNDYPLLPEMNDHARLIYERGQEAGRNPQVFSKVGDCMTASPYFLTSFGTHDYDLGDYPQLQEVIDYFSEVTLRNGEVNSFSVTSLAAESGFNTASVQDSLWANPEFCEANESPLACEYRVSEAAFAIVMFGTNDVYFFEAEPFDFYLRNIILQTIEANIVPIMSTFPIRPEYPEKSLLFNQVILKIAQDYQVPIMNLWLGLEALPNQGVDLVETIHLSAPPDGKTCYLSGENLEAGYTFRNLVVAQALDIAWRDLVLGED